MSTPVSTPVSTTARSQRPAARRGSSSLRRPRAPGAATLPLATAALAVVAALACPGDRAGADPPRPLAALLPDGATAVLEADDLRALLQRWQSSSLRRDFDKSAAGKELERSRLYLRLARNVADVEEVAGTSLGLDKLVEVAGHRSALALYAVPTTSFLLVSELTEAEARAVDGAGLFGLRGKLEPREHRGVRYLVKEPGQKKAPLAAALVGGRLLVGTDLEAFRGALVLAARAAGLPVAPKAAGLAEPKPLADAPRYRDLARVAPSQATAPISLFVAPAGLSGHYFDDYWVFGPGAGEGIEAAWIALSLGDAPRETRIYRYAAGRRPAVATLDGATIGAADVGAATARLPPEPLFASAAPGAAPDVARAILELLPLPRDEEAEAAGSDEPRAQAIADALAAAHPVRSVELIDPARSPASAVPEHHAAIAIALATPSAFDAAKLEQAIAGVLAPGLGGAATIAFRDEAGARVLRLPLVSTADARGGWALAYRRSGDAILVATDPATLARLVAATARPDTARLLDRAAALRAFRLDVDRAGALYGDTLAVLARRQNWSDPKDADLFRRSIGGLFSVVKETRRVRALGYARGPDLYVEEVEYAAR